MALLVATLEEEHPRHQALLGHQRSLPGCIGERPDVLGDEIVTDAEAGEERLQAAAALVREPWPFAGIGSEVDGRGSHCRRATSLEKKLGQKLRSANESTRLTLCPGVGSARWQLRCGAARHPWRHGSKRARRSACPRSYRVRAAPRRARGRARRSPMSRSRASSTAGRYSSTPPGRSAASSATVNRASGSPRGGQSANRPSTSLTSTRRPAPCSIGDPRGDRVGGHLPGRGQRIEGQRGGQEHGRRPADARRSAQRSAPGISSLSNQPNCSMPRIAIRCEVAADSPKRRSASRTASANPAPPGTTRSGWRSPSPPSALHKPAARRRRRVPRPPPTLTTVSTGAPRAARRAPPPVRRRQVLGDRSPEPRGDLASEERAGAAATTAPWAAADAPHGAPQPRSGAAARREEGGDRVDLAAVELLYVGAHQPGDALARERDRGRAAVGRRAVVGLGARWPRTRWTSALIAKYSDATGHQPPRTGTRGAIAARLVRSTPV